MKLFFQRSNGEEYFLREVDSVESASDAIVKFLADKNYKSYYKIWTELEDKYVVDVGSWSEFLILYK